MIQSESTTGIHFFTPENHLPFPSNMNLIQNSFPGGEGLYLNYQQYSSSSLSNTYSSTSDEAEDHQQQHRIIDERKQRRMISNRESARRSRMRKQRHLDELSSMVVHLRTENTNLIDKLNNVLGNHDNVLEENARLKEEASNLRQMLTDHLPLGSDPNYMNGLRDLDEVTCNTAHLRDESSNQSISSDRLH